MPRPVLGIIACNRETSVEPVLSVARRYVEHAMVHADCAALIVPSLPGAMRAAEVAGRLDALLLTGSPSNVAPARYGDAGGAGPFDPDRDAMALDLIDAMRSLGRPVFGICRGFQEINVAFGGTLRRDLGHKPDLDHHAPDEADFATMFEHRHAVTLTPGGELARTYGRPGLEVNSVHYQGVDRLGDGLRVEAIAPDGVIEAVSAPGVLAVQWHPEWRTAADPDAQALFRRFGELARG